MIQILIQIMHRILQKYNEEIMIKLAKNLILLSDSSAKFIVDNKETL